MERQELNTLLIEAAKVGNLNDVKILIDEGADVHAYENLPLRWAAQYGHLEIIQYLLQKGANLHVCSEDGLYRAARGGHLETVQYLLQYNSELYIKNNQEIRWAAQNGYLKTVEQYLRVQMSNPSAKNNQVLCWAAENGHLETVKYLLQRYDSHFTHFCSAEEHLESKIALVLLEEQQHLHSKADYALIVATYKNCREMAENSLQDKDVNIHAGDDRALLLAVKNRHKEIALMLLRAGANSGKLAFNILMTYLTPKFFLSLSDQVIAGIETSHQEIKEKYKWSEKRNFLKREVSFDAKISLADFYYRPGGPGYYQAISFS